MADDGTVSEQVLVAGGVSKRRRGASRRSPSGQRRRAPTPEPPKDLPLDTDEEMELLQSAESSPTKPSTTVVKRISTTEKTLVTKRSHSTPGEGRQALQETTTKVEHAVNTDRPMVVKRRSTTEKAMIAKRSQSSPGEGRQALPEAEFKPETTTVIRRRRLSDEDDSEIVVVKKSPTSTFQKLLAESVQKSPVHSPTEAVKKIPTETLKKVPVEVLQKTPTESVKKSPVESAPKVPVETVKEVPTVVKKTPVQEVQKVPVETLQNVAAEVEKKTVESVKQKTPTEESIKQKTPVEESAKKVEERKSNEATTTDEVVAKKTVEVVKTEVVEKVKTAEIPVPDEPEETFSVPPEEMEEEVGPEEVKAEPEESPPVPESKLKLFFSSIIPFMKEARVEWKKFVVQNNFHWQKIISQRNRCIGALVVMIIYCGLGGLLFRFTEGAFEAFYKCGVKRVKRDFVDSLWLGSHHLLEDEWKSQARKKLMELESQLHAAHEAGVTTYSGQRAWSFLNAVVYCLTVVTTIGYGHISPSTTTGRAVTIIYAIFGIPMFLILLADFGKLFTRGIKFIWAFVRRLYYTGSCRQVRRTVPVQEVMKGVQLVYDFATFRRPSMIPEGEDGRKAPIADPEDMELQVPLNPPQPQTLQLQLQLQQQQQQQQLLQQQQQHPTSLSIDGHEPPGTPAISTFEVDDEFNLPISVAIVILLIYIFVGATIYWTWENWGFFESFYFVFISMSTIGFGDFVPQHPMYMMASIVYLVFGLALTSMCINVVQEKLSDSFRQASAKIGATIGLRVNEEDGSVTPVPPVQIELPEVHNTTITKSQST